MSLELIGALSRRVFDVLDFKAEPTQTDPNAQVLTPPSIDPSTPEGKRTRAKLLRAWVEVGTWLTLYNKSRPSE